MARKLPAILKRTRACALKLKIKPFKKWTAAQKKAVRACAHKGR